MDYTLFDGLALGDVLNDPVNPKPFRLFAAGENRLTRNGKEYVLTLSAEQIRAIADYHKEKGEKIPIDSRHALFLAAEKAGVSENEALKAVPGQVAALGFAALEAREDGLYAAEIELLGLGAELFKAGSLRYWSPVIRGLDGKSDPACACAQAKIYEFFTLFSLIFGYGRLYCFSKSEAILWIMISMKLFYIS